MEKKICIFCSSSNTVPKIYFEEAEKISNLLVKENYDLVYGAGNLGLMGKVADVFKNGNRKVIGVIPEKLHSKGIAFADTDEMIVTKNMSERKIIMFEKSSGFISLPGGFGTLEEILEVITLKQLGYLNKPIIFLNTNGFYDFLLKQFEVIYKDHFAKETYKDLYFISHNPEEIINYLKNWVPKDFVDKW